MKLILYADDTNVLITDNSQEALQTKLFFIMKQLENWFLKNDLIITITKTNPCHSTFATQSLHITLTFYFITRILNTRVK